MSCTSTDALYSSECCVGEPTSAPTKEPTPAPVTESPTAAPTCPTEEECSEYDSAECCAADSDCYYDYDGYDIWDVPCSSEDAMAGTCCVQLTTAEPTTASPTTTEPTTASPTTAQPSASPTTIETTAESTGYHLGIPGTWQQNVDYCVANGMVLATFGCAEEVEDLFNFCGDAGQSICYIGL